MQFQSCRPALAVVVGLIASMLLAACGSTSGCTNPGAPTDQSSKAQAVAYLQSCDRAKQYEDLVPTAGMKLAQALDNGQFGPVVRLDDKQKPMAPDYSGRGTITSPGWMQSVTLNWKDGKIDPGTPVEGFQIRRAPTEPATEQSFNAPTRASNDADVYWATARTTPTGVETSDYINIGGQPSNPQGPGQFIFPTSIDELQALDKVSLAQLRSTMNNLFGPNWQS